MRIISGTHKGRKIRAPKQLPVRPTTDMAKEALFNILNNTYYFEGLKVLDLFAGTGNISFEFASRGSSEITSVDQHAGCVKFMIEMAAQFRFNIKAVKMDVFAFLRGHQGAYDVIFADPPYDLPFEQFCTIHQVIMEKKMVLPGGSLIIEHSKQTDLSQLSHFSTVRKYGSSLFSFFEIDPQEN